jgi:hypothetical protein
MEKDNLQEKIVNEGCKSYNILNFQDFVLVESKKGKHETKKSKPIKTREEFTNDVEEDITDPNDHPERFIKLREQFIEEYLE